MEHRWGQRRDIDRVVHLLTGSGLSAYGRITNVSMSGAFVESHLPVRLFSNVEVRFSALQHGRRTRLSVEAQIVRRGQSGIGQCGFGIEWQEIDLHTIR